MVTQDNLPLRAILRLGGWGIASHSSTWLRMRVLIMTTLILALVACADTAPQTPAPTLAVQLVQVVATPVALPSVTPTLAPKPTAASAPTAYITAPAPGAEANAPILMYHHVVDLPIDATALQQDWTVTPKNFDAQMQWLAHNGYHSISMAQLIAHLKNRQLLPVKPIIISFDDGWEEQYSTAFPILTRYGLSGTFFVYTHPLDHTEYMTWAQLVELTTAGMDIQSHSLTHPHLRTLTQDAAFKEIADSKAALEKRLGKPVVTFCYPFGEYNNAIVEMVKRAGYESAVTLASGYHQRSDELYTLRRIRVSYSDTLDDFAKRLP